MKLYYGRMLARNLDGQHGMSPERMQALVTRFPAIQDEVRRRRAEGEYGFLDLGAQDDSVDSLVRFAEGVGQAYDHLLVLGIGGSSLGSRALVGALRKPAWNELSDEDRDFFPRITVLENVDPTSMAAALGRIDPRRVLVNVVSKSGGTAETLAQYLVVRGWLDDALGTDGAARHLVFTTDKLTEQGETIAFKYGLPGLAERNLEAAVAATLLTAFPDVVGLEPPNAGARDTMDELAAVAHTAYRTLVWDDPAFPAFFRSFTPVDELALLEIGSRPASRPEAAATGELEALRAIPWVFAWTQNRCLLPAWYGCGAAFHAYGLEGERLAWLQRLYAEWPFFRALVENLEMTLAKSSFEIAEAYVSLVPERAGPARFWTALSAEHQRTVEAVLAIVQANELLDRHPVVQRSIRLRNPYVDPMNAIQVELLRAWRGGDEAARRPLLRSIAGIAAALRNTG